jgi:hypothetical protein
MIPLEISSMSKDPANSRSRDIGLGALAVTSVVAASVLGQLATYPNLCGLATRALRNRPSIPPDWVFAPVLTTLLILMPSQSGEFRDYRAKRPCVIVPSSGFPPAGYNCRVVSCPACGMGRVRERSEFLDKVAQWLTAWRRRHMGLWIKLAPAPSTIVS